MAYDPQIAVIHSASAQLTALSGVPPSVIDEGNAVRIEIPVTKTLLRHWIHAIPVFYLGSEFGLTVTETGQTIWLRFELGKGTSP
ncbi:hypothetical protein [Streptomyces sp. NPDC053048]|uniref:hypothetical protein n=1 Tax=Streptomyces sp. NPDC053048 TaxID=3365694 RepID=UPI0037CCF0BF